MASSKRRSRGKPKPKSKPRPAAAAGSDSNAAGAVDGDRAAASEASVWSAAGAALRARRERAPIRPFEADGPAPFTFGQAACWPPCARNPRAVGGFMSYELPIRGPLQVDHLEAAMADLVRRQHALRTTFSADGGAPTQLVRAEPAAPMRVVDLAGGDTAEALRAQYEFNETCGFNLVDGPPYRAILVRRSESEHLLLLAFQHMVWDEWSWTIFRRELRESYRHRSAGGERVDELPIQLTDFSRWQNELAGSPLAAAQMDYWRETLAGLTVPPRLFKFRGDVDRPSCAATHFVLPPAVVDALRAYRAQTDASLFVTALACYCVLFAVQTGAPDACVNAILANRARAETRRLIGPVFNTAILRVGLGGGPTFHEVVDRVRAAVFGAVSHADISGAEVDRTLIGEGRIAEITSRVQLDWRTVSDEPRSVGDVTFGDHPEPVTEGPVIRKSGKPGPAFIPSSFDLALTFVETRDQIYLEVIHRSDKASVRDVTQFVQRYRSVVLRVLRSPDRRFGALFR